MVGRERLCIPFDVNKMGDEEEPFFFILSVTTLEQWGLDEWDIARLLSLTRISHLPIFNRILRAIRQVMVYINKYINTTSSISIR